MNLDSYLNAYLDRRMKLMIDDWQLATTADIRDLSQRFRQVKHEVESLKSFERESKDRMDRMEERIRRISERMR
jgi:polyhydroxyalkanoate synthesis regulator phasin